jgi:hypothetical protein
VAANGSGPKSQPDDKLRRPSKSAKSAVADLDNYDPKSETRFRLAVHASRLTSFAPQDDGLKMRATLGNHIIYNLNIS